MQQFGWTNEHSEALRQYLREGMSYLESSKALNAKFKTAYSRSAIIGRAKRMGLFTAEQRDDPPSSSPARCSRKELIPLREARERHVPEFVPRIPLFQAYELPKLRCVEINPRHLALVDLEVGERGGRSHHVLRSSTAGRFEILRAALPIHARSHPVRRRTLR